MEKRCVCCGRRFIAEPRVSNQQYCSLDECQRARKRRWQKEKLLKDEAYRENQAAAQKEWCGRNPGYWREYRKRNPTYAEGNRVKQRERNRRMRSKIAKMDASGEENIISTGHYQLIPHCNESIAKMDAIIVKIEVISRGYASVGTSAA